MGSVDVLESPDAAIIACCDTWSYESIFPGSLCSSAVQIAAEQEAAREAGKEDEGPLEVEGFLFKRLLERKPEKKQELLTFRDHLLASSSSSDTLKVFNKLSKHIILTQSCGMACALCCLPLPLHHNLLNT